MPRQIGLRALFAGVYETFRRHQITFLAAAIAYYAFVSVIPLALLGLAIGGWFGFDRVDSLLLGADQFLTPAALSVLGEALGDSTARGGATIVGFAVLVWSASKVFRGLDVAFSRVYGTSGHDSPGAMLIDVCIVLLGIPTAIAVTALFGVLLPWIGGGPVGDLMSRVALLAGLVVVFFPMYYRFPDTPVSVRGALPGTMVAAVGWSLLATGFSLYVTVVVDVRLYGMLGGALLLVTWLYLGGIIIMAGAVVNTVVDASPSKLRADGGQSGASEPPPQEPAPDVGELGRDVERLHEEMDEKTVDRSALEAELKAYVRKRQRAGKATGWGPYLVLLYGTVMTLGAFYWLDGGWAVLAMVVVWLSTLGLYVQLVLFGIGIRAAGLPNRLLDLLRDVRR